jgi:hypothetical protein
MSFAKQMNVTPSFDMAASTLDRWLREDVATAYDAFKADPSSAISSEELRASLAEFFAGAAATGE